MNHQIQTSLGGFSYIGLIGFALYFCKDSINGRSIAKRLIKLQVVENSTGNIASPIRCFIRNIFIIIWPVEVVLTLIKPSRRLGDFVAGTKVVPFNPDLEQPQINYTQIGLSILLALGLMFLFMLPIEKLKSNIKSNKVNYVESSLNEEEARMTEQLFTDSLSTILTPDVRIYDQIQENPELKYVSVILHLNQNFLNNDEGFEQLKSLTVPLLLSKFPEGSFVGQIKYIYQQQGTMQTRTETFD